MKQQKIAVPVNQLEGVYLDIFEDVKTGDKTDKEIANSYKVELAVVKRIKKRFSQELIEHRQSQDDESAKHTEEDKEMVESKELVVEVEAPHRSKGYRLTDDDKLLIGELLEKGLTYQEIISKTGFSSATIIKYGRLLGVIDGRKRKKKSTKRKSSKKKSTKKVSNAKAPKVTKKESTKIDVEVKVNQNDAPQYLILNDVNNVIEVGLCANRHNMPVKNNVYIFGSVDKSLMFHYEDQLKVCLDFIDKNISLGSDGLPTMKLVVFTTGLNCLNAAIIKACYIRKVNLDLKNYNNENYQYYTQPMFEDFEMSKDSFSSQVSYSLNKIMRNGCKLVNLKSAYQINTNRFVLLEESKNGKKEPAILSNDDMNAWKLFQERATEIQKESSDRIALYLDECSISENGTITRTNFAKSYNFAPDVN